MNSSAPNLTTSINSNPHQPEEGSDPYDLGYPKENEAFQ
jgi:hypothetical protein